MLEAKKKNDKFDDTKTWLTIEDATRYAGFSKSFLYRNRKGDHGVVIPYALVGRKLLYNKEDIDTFLRMSGGYAPQTAVGC